MFGSIPDIRDANDVMVTGVGMVTPLGIGRQSTWSELIAGTKSGRALNQTDIDHFEALASLIKRVPAGAPVDHQQVAIQLKNCDSIFGHAVGIQQFRKTWGRDCLNRMIAFCLDNAISDAGIRLASVAPHRIGCAIGTSKASLRAMEAEFYPEAIAAERCSSSSLWHSGFMPNSPLQTVQELAGATGPSSCSVAACATGLFSILEGARYIQSGMCDVCFVGSADASLRSSVLAGFHRLGVTSRHENAAGACRPFDKDRDGFIVGEGASILVLESRRHQEARNAPSYGQITHGRSLTDPTGMTQIDGSGRVVAELLKQLTCPNVDLINLHGTGTETNDLAEANGVATAFRGQSPVCFGTKGATGHLLGAAASVEFALTCLALKHSLVPGTTNHLTPDTACSIKLSSAPISLSKAEVALKLSLGFGGHVVGCVLQKS